MYIWEYKTRRNNTWMIAKMFSEEGRKKKLQIIKPTVSKIDENENQNK